MQLWRCIQGAVPIYSEDSSGSSVWSFKGRIGRGSFWAVQGCIAAGQLLVGLVSGGLAGSGSDGAAAAVFLLGITVPCAWLGLAAQVKRWHDLDKSGFMVLLNFTLVFIPIAWIILGCKRGTPGPNQYGDDPLEPAPATAAARSASRLVVHEITGQ